MLSDITSILHFIGAITLSFLCGAATVILFIVFVFHKYSKQLPLFEKKPKVKYEKAQLGELLHQNLHEGGGSALGEKESCRFVNMLFAFIFREWRDTNQLQKWVLKKINIEFMEFMETKTASRLLQGIKVHDVSLGTNFPVFHSAQMKEPFSFTDNELPETVTLEVDMEYHGGFYLAIDVDLVFGKNAFLAVQITYLKGKIRLQFGRQPCTHWSLSFVEEPDIKFHVETSFETRQLPQLTSLIVNQIRRTIRRKHTLPHYKMRYNPFFSFQHPEPSPFDGFISDIPVQPSTLEVCVAASTRLLLSQRGEKERNMESPNYVVFATISVNAESCIGKALLGSLVSKTDEPSTSAQPITSTPTTSKATPSGPVSTFDSLQRSLLGLKKDALDRGRKMNPRNKPPVSTVKKEEKIPAKSTTVTLPEPTAKPEKEPEKDANDSGSSSNSNGASYVMVAMNFGATLREETTKDGGKAVIVENITEHNVHGQSGMKDGDTVVELNGTEITSLSQVIATIERIRAMRESFKFKVKRSRNSEQDLVSLNETLESTRESDKSTGRSGPSQDTESDHSDVDLEDYKDFVNISLQVAELHAKNGDASTESPKLAIRYSKDKDTLQVRESRPHSSSLPGPNEGPSDAPYMTLVSTPTPSASASLSKATPAGADSKLSKNSEAQATKIKETPVKEGSMASKKNSKAVSTRSRSESPPVGRKYDTLPTKPTASVEREPRSSSTKAKALKDDKKKRDDSPVSKNLLSMANAASAVATPIVKQTPKTPQSKTDPGTPASPSQQKENLSFARVDDDPDTELFKTSFVNSNQHEYSWKHESFTFNIRERHRYLNIRYWTRLVGKPGIIKTRPPQIVGCMSVPLCELEMFCRGVTSRRVTRRFPIAAPNELPQDYKWFLNDPVSQRSSFREEYCFGDTTLTINMQPKPSNKNNSSNYSEPADMAGTFFPDDETNGMLDEEMLDKLSHKTGSDYLLSAATPNGKKLLVSKQTQTPGDEEKIAEEADNAEKTVTVSERRVSAPAEVKEETPKEKPSISQFIKGFLHGRKDLAEIKKAIHLSQSANSEEKAAEGHEHAEHEMLTSHRERKKTRSHNFVPVRFTTSMKCINCDHKLWMKSGFQCNRCSAVCHKRCIEKYSAETPCHAMFEHGDEADGDAKLEDSTTDSSDESPNTLPMIATSLRNKLLGMASPYIRDENGNSDSEKRKKASKPLSKNAEDLLAVNAKEMGRDLHRDLPLSERKAMLEKQMQKVEDELHSEIGEKERLLQEQEAPNLPAAKWGKLERKILKSDERLQALALLLLHYRAGLEDCEDDELSDADMSASTLDDVERITLDDPEEAMEAVESSSHNTT